MFFLIIGGFAREAKSHLIQQIIDEISEGEMDQNISFILNEINEDEVTVTNIDSDKIQISELKGGCPCCAMEGELARLLDTPVFHRSHQVIIEVAGTCDISQLSGTLKKRPGTEQVRSYSIVEVSSIMPLLEIVPLLRRNIELCDVLYLVRGPRDNDAEVKAANEALNAIFGREVSAQFSMGDQGFQVRTKNPEYH